MIYKFHISESIHWCFYSSTRMISISSSIWSHYHRYVITCSHIFKYIVDLSSIYFIKLSSIFYDVYYHHNIITCQNIIIIVNTYCIILSIILYYHIDHTIYYDIVNILLNCYYIILILSWWYNIIFLNIITLSSTRVNKSSSLSCEAPRNAPDFSANASSRTLDTLTQRVLPALCQNEDSD